MANCYQEITREQLEAKPTAALLKLRDQLYAGYGEPIYESDDEEMEKLSSCQKIVYEILATREHVPNKIERKEMRLEKARLRKYGS